MAEAARCLDITPAAIALQIRTLEHEFGVPLVARAGKTVRVTEAGHRVLESCRTLLRDVANLKALANREEMSGELRLGSINTALNSLLPEVPAQLISIYPDMKFHIRSALSSELFDAVQRGELDAAVCLHPQFVLPKTCGWQLLREEALIALAPIEFASRDPHVLLSTMPFIRYNRNQWVGQQAERYLRKAGIVPDERFELSHLDQGRWTLVSDYSGLQFDTEEQAFRQAAAKIPWLAERLLLCKAGQRKNLDDGIGK